MNAWAKTPQRVTHAKVGREAEPAQIWGQQPAARRIDLAPNVGKVPNSAAKREDIDSGSDRTSETKVQRRPDKIEGELDRVQSRALLS